MELYLLTPPRDSFLSPLLRCIKAGVDRLQYRRPNHSDRARLEELKSVQSITRRNDIPLVVNNRPDLAEAVDAEGVHLGRDDLPVRTVVEQWQKLEIGLTRRVEDELNSPADYYGVGPVFKPRGKELSVEPCGWDGVKRVLERTDRPVYAIGGITPERARNVPEGLSGIAVITSVWSRTDPAQAVRTYRDILDNR
ncbi:MAG: thiamine phosphate synthase [bacterium]